VAGLLADTGVPLGVLPFGTLNHFAKYLGIPVDLESAIDVIAAASPHAIDIAEVNGQPFVNNSSIGIYPYMVLNRERRRRMHGLSKWRAMLFAVLRTLRYFPLHRVLISAEGWTEPCRTPCVFIGNNRYSFVAPSLGARERLDGGHLCLSVAQQQSRLALLWLACRSAIGLLDEARDLRSLEVGSAQITSRRSRLLVAMDGEVAILRPPLQYRIRPKALHVFVSVPRTH
jgi:diacylglycerol kinase family enzyme